MRQLSVDAYSDEDLGGRFERLLRDPLTPYQEMAKWRRRFWWLAAVYVATVAGCAWVLRLL